MGKPNAETQTKDKEALELKCQEFPNSKVLLISAKRPGAFLVRTASELLAGGTEVLILSALGDAMPLAIQLQMTLINKSAATTIRIETCLSKRSNTRGKHDSYTPGLQIYMRKHPEFKGSRISPGHVIFAPQVSGGFTPLFDSSPSERACATVSGNGKLQFTDAGNLGELKKLLNASGHDVNGYPKFFAALLADARKAHEANESVFVATTNSSEAKHPDVKFCLCRLPRISDVLKGNDGVVFVVVFKHKQPHEQNNNMGFVYVVSPVGNDYSTPDAFLAAIHETGENFVTALCDYNGLVKRGGAKTMQWMSTCRVCLVGGGANKHRKATKLDVAKHLLNGIAEGYRHGPAPRFYLNYDEDVFRTAWSETTGLKATVNQEATPTPAA